MSVRSDMKEQIAHFTHLPEFIEERRMFRGLVRSYTTAEKNSRTPPKRRKKRNANPRGSKTASERASEAIEEGST